MAGVRFEHVTKRFGDVVAADDFTLDVQDGEFLVLVGPSGCGKSTVLRLLAGLEELTSGNIYVGDQLVNRVRAKDRDIAMVFQSYALYPHMSVFDNMAFGLELRGVPKAQLRERVTEAARVLGLSELLDRKPRQLSGGQRQRVALGRAIVRDPAVFLFDEPLSNLDAKLRVQTRAELRRLHVRLGTTFIYVTHDQVDAMTMATRIAVMDRGVLHQVGTPQELYDQPADIFVAGFIGSPAMNFFAASVTHKDTSVELDAGSWRVNAPLRLAERLQAYSGRQVEVGIRPEHLHAPEFAPPQIEPAAIEATVDLVEVLGNETLLHLTIGDRPLVARVDPRVDAHMGESISLVLDLSHLHIFDPETRQAIPASTQSAVAVTAEGDR